VAGLSSSLPERAKRHQRSGSKICQSASLLLQKCPSKHLSFMEVLYGVGLYWRGPAMDTRRSFYLASRQDDFATPADGGRLDFSAIPYIMPANDNLRTKDRLSARCGSLLRLLVGLHSLRSIRLKLDPTQRHPRDGQRGRVTRGFGLTSMHQIAPKTSSKS